jgi:radical SAM superfamily enzyme YgiQ (UPF0313 family)
MKILLIMPDAHMHKLRLGKLRISLREMPITLCVLAALTPKHPGIELKLVDGSVEDIPYDYPADLVGISAITGCANEAYAISARFREKRVPVVLGGINVTLLPDEAKKHADAIVVGPGEEAWPRLVNDFMAGRMRKTYLGEPLGPGEPLTEIPTPLWHLQRTRRYMVAGTVEATRGCGRSCDFCTVPAIWRGHAKRPVADVIRDIKLAPGKYIAFGDVSLAEDPEYAKELLSAMVPLGKKWGGLATVDIIRDEELLSLIAASGCVFLLFGFESASQATLSGIRKGFNKPAEYKRLVDRIHALGVSVQGCFVFGFDHDTLEVFDDTVEMVNELKIDIPRYSLYTPYPGTRLFKRLLAEKRITSFNWSDYDTMHVVFEPANMTPDELYAGFKHAYAKTFELGNIFKRARGFSVNTAVNFVGNLAYKTFVRRLARDPRFATPSMPPTRPSADSAEKCNAAAFPDALAPREEGSANA